MRDFVRSQVADGDRRWTLPELVAAVVSRFKSDRRRARAVVVDLVTAGELAFANRFGHTFVEMNYLRPVRVGGGIVLRPPGMDGGLRKGEVEVVVAAGAAFGSGRHPTTRLSLQGIAIACADAPALRATGTTVWDVGTGSGVLVIAAVKMGVHRGLGIDIEACSRAEARENVMLNGLSARIEICAGPFEAQTGQVDLLLANLRLPTLAHLLTRLQKRLVPNGRIVFSGFRGEETADLLALAHANDLAAVWRAEEKGWAAVVLKKRAGRP